MDNKKQALSRQSIYGSSLCEKCGKLQYAVLIHTDDVIPPPMVLVFCQCDNPPVSIELFYKDTTSFTK
jgi:hypothetical protein